MSNTPRPQGHPSCIEVMTATNALAYLKLRKKKMGGSKRMDKKFNTMISEVENLQIELENLQNYINDLNTDGNIVNAK